MVIISDIGNEPDDQMSFVRLLLYSNELDLEAMVATTSTWQKAATHAETMHALIHAYGKCGKPLETCHRLAIGRGTGSARVCRSSGVGLAATGAARCSGIKSGTCDQRTEGCASALDLHLGRSEYAGAALMELRATKSADEVQV